MIVLIDELRSEKSTMNALDPVRMVYTLIERSMPPNLFKKNFCSPSLLSRYADIESAMVAGIMDEVARGLLLVYLSGWLEVTWFRRWNFTKLRNIYWRVVEGIP